MFKYNQRMCEHQETLMNVRTRENEREKKIINLCARRNAQAIKKYEEQ